MSWRNNRFLYINKIDEFGWSIQIGNHLEFGHCKAPDNEYNYRYVEFSLPFRNTWHMKTWGITQPPYVLDEIQDFKCDGITTSYDDSCGCA